LERAATEIKMTRERRTNKSNTKLANYLGWDIVPAKRTTQEIHENTGFVTTCSAAASLLDLAPRRNFSA
jgi:hypothetical protein